MCVYSMVVDHYTDKWGTWPYRPTITPFNPIGVYPAETTAPTGKLPTPEEIEEFRKLLDRAREYDKTHGEPECELESKKQRLRTLAKELGVEITFL